MCYLKVAERRIAMAIFGMSQTATDVCLTAAAGTALVLGATGCVLGASSKKSLKYVQAQLNDHEGRLQVAEAVGMIAYEAATGNTGMAGIDIAEARYGEPGESVRAKRKRKPRKARALEGLSNEELLSELSERGYEFD